MSDLTEQEVRAFVGVKADYYLKKWWPALAGTESTGNVAGFNWAAFFLSGLWLPYRKMYRATAILFGVILLETLFEEVVYVGMLGKSEAPGSLGRFVGLIVALVCGGFGNAWYLSHAQKKINILRSKGLSEEAYSLALAKQGGASVAAALGSFLLLILGAALIVVLSDLLLRGS